MCDVSQHHNTAWVHRPGYEASECDVTFLLFQLLISSDSMARGMDVEGVGGVVNYEAPHQFKTYLHRVGRTARAGERGVAYTLLAPEEVRGPSLIHLLAIG